MKNAAKKGECIYLVYTNSTILGYQICKCLNTHDVTTRFQQKGMLFVKRIFNQTKISNSKSHFLKSLHLQVQNPIL